MCRVTRHPETQGTVNEGRGALGGGGFMSEMVCVCVCVLNRNRGLFFSQRFIMRAQIDRRVKVDMRTVQKSALYLYFYSDFIQHNESQINMLSDKKIVDNYWYLKERKSYTILWLLKAVSRHDQFIVRRLLRLTVTHTHISA